MEWTDLGGGYRVLADKHPLTWAITFRGKFYTGAEPSSLVTRDGEPFPLLAEGGGYGWCGLCGEAHRMEVGSGGGLQCPRAGGGG